MKSQQLIKQAGKYHAAGKLKQAERIYRQLLKSNPNDLTLLRVLGMLERERRNGRAALDWFKKAEEVSPNDPILLAEIALTLEQLGRNEEAMTIALQASNLAPTDISVAMFIAKMYLSRGNASMAAQALEKAIDSDPNSVEAWHLLTLAVHSSGVLPVPLQFARKLIQLQPNEAQPHASLATALRLNGELNASLKSYERALAMNPTLTEAIAGCAEVFESLGRTQDAQALLKQATPSDSVLIALVTSRIERKLNQPTKALEAIDMAMTPSLSPYHKSNLLMHRGRILEELERYDEAWNAWEEGNTLHAHSFDLDSHVALVDAIIKTPIKSTDISDSRQPIFIIGMFRSGTTLLEQILGAHPDIDASGEVDQMLRFAKEAPYPDCVTSPKPTWSQQYLDRLDSNAKHVSDKMPMNYLHVGLIHTLFPHATIIHMKRHPLDTCVSCFANSFSASHAYTSSLESLIAVYKQYQRVMHHWQTILPNRMIEVQYETLVTDLEGTITKVLKHIGVPYDSACLAFYNVRRIAITPSVDQVRRPLYTSSIDRWKRFTPHIDILIDRLQSSE